MSEDQPCKKRRRRPKSSTRHLTCILSLSRCRCGSVDTYLCHYIEDSTYQNTSHNNRRPPHVTISRALTPLRLIDAPRRLAHTMTTRTPPGTTLSTPSPTERPDPFDGSSDSGSAMRLLRPIHLVVATAHPSRGIGLKGTLPWPSLRADMNFFQRVTRDSRPPSAVTHLSDQDASTMNAVVMGRKTYDSIPQRFRPLAGRLNVVITRRKSEFQRELVDSLRGPSSDVEVREESLGRAGELVTCPSSNSTGKGAAGQGGMRIVLISDSLSDTLNCLTRGPLPFHDTRGETASDDESSMILRTAYDIEPGNIFVIGGAEIYQQTLALSTQPTTRTSPSASASAPSSSPKLRILQTLVRRKDGADIECDTFFPSLSSQKTRGVSTEELASWINGEANAGKQIQLPQGAGEWGEARDEKGEFEVKLVGWEI
jgi:dihydrofolate reductase